jgi:cyclic dehypoxanthinyl futalosine synthase
MAKIDALLERALNGERLGLEEVIALWESDEIEKLGWAANKLMERRHRNRLPHL